MMTLIRPLYERSGLVLTYTAAHPPGRRRDGTPRGRRAGSGKNIAKTAQHGVEGAIVETERLAVLHHDGGVRRAGQALARPIHHGWETSAFKLDQKGYSSRAARTFGVCGNLHASLFSRAATVNREAPSCARSSAGSGVSRL
jgi:hypothetical protein